MSDLINRADAIRVISEEYHNRGGNFDGLDAIRELETLPSKGGDAEILNEDFRPKYMQQCPNNGADLISRADAIAAVESAELPSADAVPQLRQTDTLIIADALRYLAKDTERHLVDRTRADALRQQFLKYGASMCKGGVE